MRLGQAALKILLQTNVAELRFLRRMEKPGFGSFRRMLCTNDKTLLMSEPGRRVLRFVRHNGTLRYDPASKNLVVAWDIFMQNYRMINCNDVEVIAIIKSSPDPMPFWRFFYDSIIQMSAVQKARFMNT